MALSLLHPDLVSGEGRGSLFNSAFTVRKTLSPLSRMHGHFWKMHINHNLPSGNCSGWLASCLYSLLVELDSWFRSPLFPYGLFYTPPPPSEFNFIFKTPWLTPSHSAISSLTLFTLLSYFGKAGQQKRLQMFSDAQNYGKQSYSGRMVCWVTPWPWNPTEVSPAPDPQAHP